MKKSIASLVSTVFLLLATIGACAAGAEKLQLPEDVLPQLKPLLEQAMQQSPKVLERNLDLVMADADAYVARSSSLPSVGGSFTYQAQQESQVGLKSKGLGDRIYYSLSVNQPVWQWGALEATRKISRIDRDLAQLNYGDAYRALAAEIRAAYLSLVLQKLLVRNAEDSLRLARENLTRQEARYRDNQVTGGAITIGQLRIDEASLAMRRAKADLGFALRSLRSLCGSTTLALADIPELIADITQPPAVEPVVATSATDFLLSVQIAEKEVAKAKLACVAPRYALYPRLGLCAGVSRDQTTRVYADTLGNPQTSMYQSGALYAGVQVNWNIFDGFSNKGQRLAALTRLRRAEQHLSTLQESAAVTLERERDNVGFAWDSYQVAKLYQSMAQGGLVYQRQEAERGLVSQEQLDAAQGNAFSSQYSSQAALAAYLNAVVQYLGSKGADPVARIGVQKR